MIKVFRECPKGWAKYASATEITEFIEKNSKLSVGSVAKPTKLDTLSIHQPIKAVFLEHIVYFVAV